MVGFNEVGISEGLGLSDAQLVAVDRETTVILGQELGKETLLGKVALQLFDVGNGGVGVIVWVGSNAHLVDDRGFVHDTLNELLFLRLYFFLCSENVDAIAGDSESLLEGDLEIVDIDFVVQTDGEDGAVGVPSRLEAILEDV